MLKTFLCLPQMYEDETKQGHSVRGPAHQLLLILKALRAGSFQIFQASGLQQLLQLSARVQINLLQLV